MVLCLPPLQYTLISHVKGTLLRVDTGVSDKLSMLLAGNIYDSLEIAQWADAHSKRAEAASLFPEGRMGDIDR